MDASNLILRDDIATPNILPNVQQVDTASKLKKEETAKNFEAVFLDRLLSEMKDTVIDWGSEKDGTSKQIDGIFWSFLARGIAQDGGFGLWKDIYKLLNEAEGTMKGTQQTIESVG